MDSALLFGHRSCCSSLFPVFGDGAHKGENRGRGSGRIGGVCIASEGIA